MGTNRRTGIRKLRGKWQARWYGLDGEPKSEVHATYKDAELARRRHLVEIEETRRGLRKLAPSGKTFAELCDEWMAVRAANKRSKKSDESIIRAHLRPAFGNETLITAIDFARIERFKAERAASHPNTVNHQLRLLSAMLRHARDIDWLVAAPKVRQHKVPLVSKDFRYLRTKKEIRRFLLAARELDQEAAGLGEPLAVLETLYTFAILTGLRCGELAALRWEDIDLGRRLIHVQRSWDGPTKNGDSRFVPVVDALLPMLRGWKLRAGTPLVFPNSRGTMFSESARVFQDRLHVTLARAEFPESREKGRIIRHITFHGLRHTFASHWMMEGGDIFRLQKILGHRNVQMTQRYAHLAPEAFAADHGRFAGFELPTDGGVVPLRAAT
ncbi:MAG: site-specific integrase [Deltaproteobacteria bacterium]|nr:site-specific integrase [Deltaproteobacteria bacterium]